jgi:hypothetical protein
MMILLIILLIFQIISSSFKLGGSNSLDLSPTTGLHDVAPKARVSSSSGRPGNEEAHELLLESLTLLRDVMVEVKSGSTK